MRCLTKKLKKIIKIGKNYKNWNIRSFCGLYDFGDVC